MCGIIGYTGLEQVTPILLDGLKRLEYRGYDSAGVAVMGADDRIQVAKAKGRLQVLSDQLDGGAKIGGTVGIGHTRWATHGKPSNENSHPHTSESGRFAIVHNGIIENYQYLRKFLTDKGVRFTSETDTETVAHLLDYYYKGDILDAVVEVLRRVEGSYALGILCADRPDEIVAVRKDSPLIVGLGTDGNYIASDIPAILPHTRDIYQLTDNEIAVIRKDSVALYNLDKEPVDKEVFHVDWDVDAAEKGGYEHFMFKEIMEQPAAFAATLSPRIRDGKIVLDGVELTEEYVRGLERIHIVACGTAYHVGVVGKYAIEKLARIPVDAALASEFRYSDPIVNEKTLTIVISQSGETADTIAALRESKRLGARTLAIVNVVGSTIANEADDVLYTWAGPEIAVASTKAYTTQLGVMYLLCLQLAGTLGRISAAEYDGYVAELQRIPDKMEAILKDKEKIQYYASRYFSAKDVFFIGRNFDYAVAMEASLKLKEISYMHSEAYAAGELKHGTISLIEEGTPVVALATNQRLYEKIMSNVKEVTARGASVIALTTAANAAIADEVAAVLTIPETDELLLPCLSVLPMQLFAYYVAALRGCDIDKPRNLAKSVTVE